MLICQRNTDLQPNLNSQEDSTDWSSSSAAYPNLEELPTFITQQRQSAPQRTFTTTADPQHLQGKQLQVYTLVQQHLEAEDSSPLHMIVSGTAGTGKSYLIQCLRLLLGNKLCVAAPTGVAAFNVDGHTLHSLLNLPTKGEFKDLEGEHLHRIQQSLANVQYLIIDEMSMVGRKIFGQVDKRLRQVFPHCSDQLFGGCSCLLFGDFGQLPPVMDLPLYTTVTRTALSDLGSSAYQLFDQAVVLNQVMRQSGDDPSQVLFRNILLHLRDGQVTQDDWKHLMKQTPAQVQDLTPFTNALRLFPTIEAVVEYNVSKLRACGQPIATIKAVHTGPNASKASPDDASGLQPIICLAVGARVMLSSNLWVDMGLVNGAMGTIKAICYRSGEGPPALPVAVTVQLDTYSGPTLPDGTVPITPLRRTWSSSGAQCSRLQLPLKLAWAVTIHKAQGLTLDKVVIDIGKKEFSYGLTFVACSRVRHLTDLLFDPPFALQRLTNLAKSQRLQERQLEDTRLRLIELTTFPDQPTTSPISSPTPTGPPINHCIPLPHDLNTASPPPLDLRNPSPPHQDLLTPSPLSTPSPTSSPPSMDLPTPSPPSTHSDTPSPPPMDFTTPSLPTSPSPTTSHPSMDLPTPSPACTHSDTPSPPPMDFATPSLPTSPSPTTSHCSMDLPTPSPPSTHSDTPSPPPKDFATSSLLTSPSPQSTPCLTPSPTRIDLHSPSLPTPSPTLWPPSMDLPSLQSTLCLTRSPLPMDLSTPPPSTASPTNSDW